MNPGFLLILTIIFYISGKQTADAFMMFCAIYTLILTTCAFFYKRDSENRPAKAGKTEPLPHKKQKQGK
ncbi:MAG: hypothetical protein HKM93_04745 [Desulfobacteraceae bacterium]|nr:hypothetical protein [Desulfobacteraceae bacterium]